MRESRISKTWVGQDGRNYRDLSIWTTYGWKTILQYQDALGNWNCY